MYYVGTAYEVTARSASVEEKAHVGSSAVVTRRDGVAEVKYVHRDRLGSIDAVTDAWGADVPEDGHGYDAFGDPRGLDWHSSAHKLHLVSEAEAATTRGFTEHEHLDGHELIGVELKVADNGTQGQGATAASGPVSQTGAPGQQALGGVPWTANKLQTWLEGDLAEIKPRVDSCASGCTTRDSCARANGPLITRATSEYRIGMQMLRLERDGFRDPPVGTAAYEALKNPDELRARALLRRIFEVARGQLFGVGSNHYGLGDSAGHSALMAAHQERAEADPYYRYTYVPKSEDIAHTKSTVERVLQIDDYDLGIRTR